MMTEARPSATANTPNMSASTVRLGRGMNTDNTRNPRATTPSTSRRTHLVVNSAGNPVTAGYALDEFVMACWPTVDQPLISSQWSVPAGPRLVATVGLVEGTALRYVARGGSHGRPEWATTPTTTERTMALIKVTDLAYGRLRSPDLDLAEEFLTHFGMARAERTENALYMRGTDPAHHIHVTEKGEPGFVGIAYYAASEEDLHKVARVPGASGVEDIDEPGGGKRVRLKEPNGYRIEVS